MPSYTTYLRQVMDADDDIQWITMKGNHIPIKEGQTKEEAVKEFLANKQKGQERQKKIAQSKVDAFKGKNDDKSKDIVKYHTSEVKKLDKEIAKTKALSETWNKPEAEKLVKNTFLSNPNTLKEFANHFGISESAAKRAAEKYGDEFYNTMVKDPMKGVGMAVGGENKTELAPKENESDLKKWDKEVTKYHDEEEKIEQTRKAIQSDLGKFADAYNKLYQDKDSFEYNPSDLDKEYNKAMHNDKFKEWVQSMVKERGDVFASDRELHALLIVAKEKGLIPQEKKAKAKSKGDSPLVKAVAKALGKSEAEAESEIDGAAQYIKDLMKSNDLRNGDVEETLRGLGVESDYAEELLEWATPPKKKKTSRKPDNHVYVDKKHPHVHYVDPKAWNSPANDPWYGLYE